MRSDTDIERDVKAELHFRPDIDERDIAAKVNNAVVSLTGFTRTYLDIRPAVKAGEISQRIEEALRRSAQVDAGHIIVDTRGSAVTLRGRVRSWPEREEAEQTAWSAPGVTRVDNEITVGFG
ncbi:MAG TPA: BON domain-containing protein [Steroidobacteraceae bacterium]|nr:BON domain-containing protein [Steroidobacteraceae bacterium]